VWLGNDDGTPTKKITGGGLPVQLWSRFMKPAHQGVPVATLPGWSAGPFAGFAPPFGGMAPPAPLAPPAAVPNAEAPVRPMPAGGGIDDWLLDRLFGRR
jgi:penicillin-binding protein 1A